MVCGLFVLVQTACAGIVVHSLSPPDVGVHIEYGGPGEVVDRGFFQLAITNSSDEPICVAEFDTTGEIAKSFVVQTSSGRISPRPSDSSISVRPIPTGGVPVTIIPAQRSARVFVDLSSVFEFEEGERYTLDLLLPVYRCRWLVDNAAPGVHSSYQLRHRIDTSGDADVPLAIPKISAKMMKDRYGGEINIVRLEQHQFTYRAN